MTITVYTKPNCVQCNATYKALDKEGIAYNKVDISLDDDARDYVMALGYLQAPISPNKIGVCRVSLHNFRNFGWQHASHGSRRQAVKGQPKAGTCY